MLSKITKSLLKTLTGAGAILLTIPASARSCKELAKITIPGVSITFSNDVVSGQFTPPGEDKMFRYPGVLPCSCDGEARFRFRHQF